MNTFLIFFFVFGIFAWCIWKLLNYTRNTIGENSPLKVVRVYQIGEWQYFLKFENLVFYYMLVIGFLTAKAAFSILTSDINLALTRILIFIFGLIPMAGSVFYFVLDFNHWENIRNVILTTNPVAHELELTFPHGTLLLRDGDLEKVVITYNEAKLRFSYLTYYLKDGRQFTLSDRMPGIEVIQEYFRKIPTEYCKKGFPYIK